jgi:hypothetical protein
MENPQKMVYIKSLTTSFFVQWHLAQKRVQNHRAIICCDGFQLFLMQFLAKIRYFMIIPDFLCKQLKFGIYNLLKFARQNKFFLVESNKMPRISGQITQIF